MSKRPIAERALAEALKQVKLSTTLAPGPGTNPSTPKAALRRCCGAWQRAFDACMESPGGNEFRAARDAGEAYCNAMPMLAGSEGVRDFIACVAHGILIGSIRREKSGQLLYAAQVALGSIQRDRKQPNPPSVRPDPTPSH